MPTARTTLSTRTSSNESAAPDRDAGRRQARRLQLLLQRSARLAGSTGLAGSLALVGIVAGPLGGVAQAQVVSVCTGLQLDPSTLRDSVLAPVVNGIVAPVEGSVNSLIGTVDDVIGLLPLPPILPPVLPTVPGLLDIDVTGILDNATSGAPIGLQAVDLDGDLIGPDDDCVLGADGFQLATPGGLAIGGNAITGLGANGNAAVAAEIDALAIGDNAETGDGAAGAIALGVDSSVGVDAAGAIALGNEATVAADAVGSLALGAGSAATAANSVALGAGSTAGRGASADFAALALGEGQASTGEVAIGGRTLTGLAPGSLPGDAVNVAQLGSVATALQGATAAFGGGAAFDPATGLFTAPEFVLNGGTLVAETVADALANLDGRVIANTTAITNLTNIGGGGGGGGGGGENPGNGGGEVTPSLVQQAAPGADITVGAATDGAAVRLNGTGGATRRLTGVTDGAIADGSTDAVTGNQAFDASASVASALGGGSAVAADGTVTAPTYTIDGTGYTNAGSAFAALDTNLTALRNRVDAFTPGNGGGGGGGDGGGGNLVFVSVNSDRGPARAAGAESTAVGGGATASGSNSAAFGSGASAGGVNSSAFGAGATAAFDNSAAFGAGAVASRSNQMVFGTSGNTYTMPGLATPASRAAQSGPIDVVTTDAAGNLASLPLSDFFSGMSGIESRLSGIDRRFERQSDGIAIAMAMGAVNLPAGKSFALTGSVGYFDDTAAFGLGAIGEISDNWYVNGGVGVGTERGTVGGRAGLTYAW